MTDRQCALAYELVRNVAFRELIENTVEDEIVDQCARLRAAISADKWHEAAKCEGRMQALEEFWGLLEQTARRYKAPVE